MSVTSVTTYYCIQHRIGVGRNAKNRKNKIALGNFSGVEWKDLNLLCCMIHLTAFISFLSYTGLKLRRS